MMQYTDIDQIVSTTHDTVNRLMKHKNGGDALILYLRYIQQRKMQENNQTLSSTRFMMKATGRGQGRLLKAKDVLLECNFIEDIIKNGRTYTKINFVINSPSVSDLE